MQNVQAKSRPAFKSVRKNSELSCFNKAKYRGDILLCCNDELLFHKARNLIQEDTNTTRTCALVSPDMYGEGSWLRSLMNFNITQTRSRVFRYKLHLWCTKDLYLCQLRSSPYSAYTTPISSITSPDNSNLDDRIP